MTPLESNRPRRAGPALVFLLLVLVFALGAAWYLFRARFESQPPQVRLDPDTGVAGLAPLEIVVADPGSGLKSVSARSEERRVGKECRDGGWRCDEIKKKCAFCG